MNVSCVLPTYNFQSGFGQATCVGEQTAVRLLLPVESRQPYPMLSQLNPLLVCNW